MNKSPDILDRLFALARGQKPDTSRAELAFETRLLARIRSIREQDAPWFAVARLLLPIFGAIVLGLAVWETTEPRNTLDDLCTAVAVEGNDPILIAALGDD